MTAAIPGEIQLSLKNEIGALKSFSSASGGCINNGGRLVTSQGNFFIKWNSRGRYPAMFEVESKGLKLLDETKSVHVPRVVLTRETESFQYLLLEYIESASRGLDYWRNLGQQLADLHRHTSITFGLDHDNYIGSLHQSNRGHSSWIEFFIEERINVQVKMALDRGAITNGVSRKVEMLTNKLTSFLPEGTPSLLHGDLWNGNVIVSEQGNPCLIDPAVYYGNREIEIAFTRLFGGFANEFYQSYDSCFPLEQGFEDRVDLYNLYPLLVHVNLFGGGYLSQVNSILRRFV